MSPRQFLPVLPEGYNLQRGSSKDKALLLKFMTRTYREQFPQQQDFAHLARTVEQYFSPDTSLWWVEQALEENKRGEKVACLWIGNAIDQVKGDRFTYILLVYVSPAHRRQGIGTALMSYAQERARQRGDGQIGLQVFTTNQPAFQLYRRLGYETQSLLMVKSLE